MAYPIKSNPSKCWNEQLRNGRDCFDCYYSQVRGATWCGSQRCYGAGCLELDVNRLTDTQRKQMGL